MPLAHDLNRCLGRKSLAVWSDVCPRRDECARYLVLLDESFVEQSTCIRMWLCRTPAHEMRLEPAEIDG